MLSRYIVSDCFATRGWSQPGSSVHGIFQARILEWVDIPFFRGSSWPRDWTRISCTGRWMLYHWATWKALIIKSMKGKWKSLSCVQLFVTPGTGQSMESSRLEYWSGWPFPSPGDLPNPGVEPRSATLQADSLLSEPQGKPKNTGVGSLSLLQWIFPTQESDWGLLHRRQILYQLSSQGSPTIESIIR